MGLAALGRQELRSLAGRVDLALGDSEFNRQELEDLGFPRTGVMPIAVDLERLTTAPRRPALEKIRGGIAVSEMARRWQVEQLGGDPVLIPNGVRVAKYAAAPDAAAVPEIGAPAPGFTRLVFLDMNLLRTWR